MLLIPQNALASEIDQVVQISKEREINEVLLLLTFLSWVAFLSAAFTNLLFDMWWNKYEKEKSKEGL